MSGANRVREPPDESSPAAAFGDLTRAVALEAPVCYTELCRALDRLDGGAPVHRPVRAVHDATVHFVGTATWNQRSADRGVRPACELAARAVHRRMAESLGAPPPPPRTDPFVVWE